MDDRRAPTPGFPRWGGGGWVAPGSGGRMRGPPIHLVTGRGAGAARSRKRKPLLVVTGPMRCAKMAVTDLVASPLAETDAGAPTQQRAVLDLPRARRCGSARPQLHLNRLVEVVAQVVHRPRGLGGNRSSLDVGAGRSHKSTKPEFEVSWGEIFFLFQLAPRCIARGRRVALSITSPS